MTLLLKPLHLNFLVALQENNVRLYHSLQPTWLRVGFEKQTRHAQFLLQPLKMKLVEREKSKIDTVNT